MRGDWGVPKISFMKIFHRAILIAEWQGRPQGSPLPDCIASMCTVRWFDIKQTLRRSVVCRAALVLRCGVGCRVALPLVTSTAPYGACAPRGVDGRIALVLRRGVSSRAALDIKQAL